MPLFHFHVSDGGDWHRDHEGTQCASADQARRDAVRIFSELLSDKEDEFWGRKSLRLDVTDANDALLFSLGMVGMQGKLRVEKDRRFVAPSHAYSH